ncbi:hypothetical protein DFH27DRAFT_610638 [Peziza echinospora]|nr:hypothetical protein DFH27DRAFT_610638 [Peziza echinospora]
MGRLLLVVPGRRRHSCGRLVTIILGFMVVTYLTVHHVRSTLPKIYPTSFPADPADHLALFQLPETLPPPKEKAFRTIDAETLNIDGDRYVFLRNLAHGYEGQSRIYLDSQTRREVVIKTFFKSTRVNPLPEHLRAVFNPARRSQRWLGSVGRFLLWPFGLVEGGWGGIEYWPTEIPGTLWFTGKRGEKIGTDDTTAERAYVEVLDYFYLKNRWVKNNWQLVMPYYEDGTIDGLAKLIRHLGLRPEEVDRVYRDNFLEYMDSLRRIHVEGYCHDDIKVDNIFVSRTHNGTTWLVSDIGNIREFNHAHHASYGTNCRVSDVENALRTYVWFLRLASGGKRSASRQKYYDEEFYRGRKSWSWVYWEWKSLSREHLDDTHVDVISELKRVFELEAARGGRRGEHNIINPDGPSRIPTSASLIAAQEAEFSRKVRGAVDELARDRQWWKRGNMEMPSWLWRDDIIIEGWQRSAEELDRVGLAMDAESGSEGVDGGATQLRQQQMVIQNEGPIDAEMLAKAIEWELGKGGKRGIFDIIWRKLDGPS